MKSIGNVPQNANRPCPTNPIDLLVALLGAQKAQPGSLLEMFPKARPTNPTDLMVALVGAQKGRPGGPWKICPKVQIDLAPPIQ